MSDLKNKEIKSEDNFYNSLGMTSISQFYTSTSDISQFKPDQSTLDRK